MLVKLFTSSGGSVTEAELPPFNKYPDVLMWGERIFKFERVIPGKPEWGRYLEAFSFYIVPQLEIRNAKELEKLPNRHADLIDRVSKKKN